jgi:phosphate acetyltransferase
MARSVFIASVEGRTIKSAIALGVLESLKSQNSSVGVFRPVTAHRDRQDWVLELLIEKSDSNVTYKDCIGVSYQEVHKNPNQALADIVTRFKAFEKRFDAVLVLGSDFTDVVTPTELSFNARVATNIAAPMLLVLNGRGANASYEHLGQLSARSVDEVTQVLELALEEVTAAHTELLAVIVNRAEPGHEHAIREGIEKVVSGRIPVWVIPELPGLVAPRMKQIQQAVQGQLLFGSPERLQSEAVDVVVAAMTEINVLTRLKDNAVVVVPGDRTDVILPLLMADQAENFPNLAGIVLNGGFQLPETILRLIEGLRPTVPVVVSSSGSFDTTMQIIRTRGMMSKADPDKVSRALKLFLTHVDAAALAERAQSVESSAVTPLLFENSLFERARLAKRIIVLPEGDDDRVLKAADEVLRQGIADLIILGDPTKIAQQATAMGLELQQAKIWSIADSPHFQSCVDEYVKLRAHKGVTQAQAREVMLDVSYFGTMLVQLGIADGMVSGAAHTTAHTIRPAFEFVKTKPGVESVSSVFLMALDDRVLVYGDCAVIPEPTVEQLADIAISSAATARQFNIEPHIAMLSYSTGTSGSGAEVEKVRQATELVRKRAPELSIEGPIQYDAAVDAAVAAAKLPGSAVAGHATVFVFPDLNTGNNTYKAVQRTAGAVAIGPVLQGLNKPVNDLSRGALVKDIVNTIAITAIQAGAQA